jgi:acyl carrier protein
MKTILCTVARFLLWLRYKVLVTGIEQVAAKGKSGILFLPNHPALVDPVILITQLYRMFAPRALADQEQVDRPFFRRLAAYFRPILLQDVARLNDAAAREAVEQAMTEIVSALKRGENVILYPAGHIKRSRYEELGGNSGIETILKMHPEVRIVLVRTSGLWGSSFSRAAGHAPNVARNMLNGARHLLASGVFFAPRRMVAIELVEPADFPRAADRNAVNRCLEDFYNHDAPPNTYVPYTPWERGGTRAVPEPQKGRFAGSPDDVPAATRELVIKHLRKETGKKDIRDEQLLSRDLGLDSLALVTLSVWIESEFGYPVGDNAANLVTVGDVMLAAVGTVVSAGLDELKPIPPAWFRTRPSGAVAIPAFSEPGARDAGPGYSRGSKLGRPHVSRCDHGHPGSQAGDREAPGRLHRHHASRLRCGARRLPCYRVCREDSGDGELDRGHAQYDRVAGSPGGEADPHGLAPGGEARIAGPRSW